MTKSFSKLDLFNRWAASYDRLFPSVFYQAIHQRLLEYTQLPPSPQVLDLGCGTGRLLDRLANQIPDLTGTGVDFSPAMIQQANQHNHHPARLTFIPGDADSLPVEDESFDAVFNTVSFLHYLHPEQVLAEVRRVLRTGGQFYLADFTLRWATEPKTIGASPNSGIRLYSPEVRQHLGQQAGLTLVEHHYLLGPVLLTIFRQ